MNYKEKADWFKANNPFKNITGELYSVDVVKNETATTGNAFCVVNTHNKKYKLSFHDDEKTAIRIDQNVRKCPYLLPKYHGRYKSIVLFDWIDGAVLTNMLSDDQVYKLGILYGEIHHLNDTKDISSRKRTDRVLRKFKELCDNNSDLINSTLKMGIINKFNSLVKHLNHDIILEMNDANPANIIEDKQGKLIIVDEEALNHNIKGRGYIGYLRNFNKNQTKIFWKGYKTHHAHDYFTRDYEAALLLFNTISSFTHRYNKYGSEHSKTKQAYEALSNYDKL